MTKSSERSHNQAKHKRRWADQRALSADEDDDYARWRKDYFRGARPDLDPQSQTSKVLEFLGLDPKPYAQNADAYDYRKKQWEKSVASGNPDMSWSMPELSDEGAETAAIAAERTLGNWNVPLMASGQPPIQDKMHPFPDSWMGKREREGDPRIGALPHFIQQWDWLSPYSATDVLSAIGPDSPETVQRDIDAWKGGSSAVDRAVGGLVGADMGEASANPYVDPVEFGSLAASFAVPMGAAQKAKKAEATARRAAKRSAPNKVTTASAEARTPFDAPVRPTPRNPDIRPVPKEPTIRARDDAPMKPEPRPDPKKRAVPQEPTLRDAINASFDKHRIAKRK